MLNCLIVEDNPLNWMIMQNQLAKLGMHANVCTNGIEALNFCKKNPLPSLILLDGTMPEMDGVTFLREMRSLPDGHKPYVVFCSSSLARDAIAEALNVGAECHFPKPISRDQILYAVKQVQTRFTTGRLN